MTRPPLHSLIAMSRARLERESLTTTDAVISITSPDEIRRVMNPPTLTGAGAVLWLCFHDISEPLDTDHGHWLPLSHEQGQAIVTFVQTLPAHITRLLVHCEEGRHRSTSVVQALRSRWPHASCHCPDRQTPDDGNPHVLQTLISLLNPPLSDLPPRTR